MPSLPIRVLCHEWTTTYGGSEQVAARIAKALEIEDVFTLAADPDLAARLFPGAKVHIAHRLGRTRFARTNWKWLLPSMARAWRSVDLSSYDVVITSSHAAVNSVRPRPGAKMISYCHTPMRYAWETETEIGRIPRWLRPAWPTVARRLRAQDRRRAARVDQFVANSDHVAERIRRYYGKSAITIYPPVDTDLWTPPADDERADYFLIAGRLVAYKRADVAVRAAASAGIPLVVAGSGPELQRLTQLAGPETSFIQNPSDERLRELYRRARALIFPGIEDFGMTMIEAQACGTPVIAFARGGALEAVKHDETGLLYEDPSAEGLSTLLRSFDGDRFTRAVSREHAKRFDAKVFDDRFRRVVEAVSDDSVGVFTSD